jgi:nucleotide sugar dehydrogenase
MLRNVGIIGFGFVGRSVAEVFRHNSEVLVIDPKFSSSAELYAQPTDYLELIRKNVKLVFVCVPVPTLEDRSLDLTIIYDVLDQLVRVGYSGIVVLKSTIAPDAMHEIYEKYAEDTILKKSGPLKLVYSPEFLREGHWQDDAVNPRMIILGGDYRVCREVQYIYEHNAYLKSIPRYFITSLQEASLVKYTINTFLAMKVTFFNQLYQYYTECNEGKEPHPEIWSEFTEMIASDYRVGTSHMQVPGPDGRYGYGGTCFPKDVKAFIGSDKKGHLSILREAELANTKIRLTGKVEDSNNS